MHICVAIHTRAKRLAIKGLKMTYKSLSLAFTAKRYALNNTEDVGKYIFDNLNEQMVKAIDLLKNLDYDNLIVALVSLMTEAELEKLHAPAETFFLTRERGAGRPTKKERREIEQLWDRLDF